MAKQSKRSQQIRAKKNARRQAKKRTMQTSKTSLSQVGAWPLFDCRIASAWRDTKMIATILVARKSPFGQVAMGCFLVDLACLGVKDAMSRTFSSEGEYEDFCVHLEQRQPLKDCDLDLAAKVIDEATRYARDLGFAPHRDARKALPILGNADPRNCAETVPLGGDDGKPFYISGPHDNAQRIIATLVRNVGPGNFHFFAPVEGSLPPDAV